MRATISLLFILSSFLVLSTAHADSKKKLGIILPLTGEAASYGEQFRSGLLLNSQAAEFDLLFEDSQFDPRMAALAADKLLGVNRVDLLVSFGGATCEVVNHKAKTKGVVHLAAGCNTAEFKDVDSSNFRMDVNESIAANKTVNYLKTRGVKRIGFLFVNNGWGQTIIDYTKSAAIKAGISVVAEIPFASSDAGDLRSSLIRVREVKPDIIFFISLPNLTPKVLSQIRDLKLGDIPLMSNISIENPEVMRGAKRDLEGVLYLAVKEDLSSRAVAKDFYSSFPGGNPFAAWGYDAVSLASKALSQSNPRKFLQGLSGFAGAFNSYTFDQSGEVHFAYEVREIRDGRSVPIKILE